MLRRGEIERLTRGLYRITDAEPTEFETIAQVCKRVPHAIVCLLTALHIHDIGTQAPRKIWIAIDRKARKPKVDGLPIRIVRFSGPMLHYGVEEVERQGVRIRYTSPARTVVDCFRYRNKIGMDIPLEALSDCLRWRRISIDSIMRAAEACRAATLIRPYIEAMVA
jgi:predicted transcriptional regulator of viral defense system